MTATRPLSALIAALRAVWSRRRRDGRTLVACSRVDIGGVVRLAFEIEVPLNRASELRDAVSAAVADAAAGIGLVVGSVGIVPGEAPHLVALAPRRDTVAPSFRDALAPHAGRPTTHLWLALAPGTYLASVVDPYRSFSGDDDVVAAIVRSGKADCALTSASVRTSRGVRLSLGVYASRSELRKLLSLVRNGLDVSSDGPAAR